MIRTIVLAGWLGVVWVALWAEISPANVLSGLLVAVGVLLVFPADRPPRIGHFRPVAALRFAAVFTWWILKASVEVAWEVLTPRNRDSEAIIELPIPPTCSDTVMTLLSNAIGLTPGTVVVDVADDRRSLFVHALFYDDPARTRADLLRLQTALFEAFGSDEAVAWCHDAERAATP